MLGYVRADKSELLMGDYEIYRGIYCSLCNALGRNYSPLARLLLSYDFAFAALMMLAVSPDPCTFNKKSCPFNFTKKCWCCDSRDEINLCSHYVIIISYYKIIDNLHDRGIKKKILSLLAYPFVALMHLKAKRLAPEADEITASGMALQAQTEKDENCGIDKAAHPSADALGKLFSLGYDGEEKDKMYHTGYLLGRYIYILDAADDLESDLKKGNFNPFCAGFPSLSDEGERARFADRAEKALNLTHAALLDSLDNLEIKRFGTIAENILLRGIDSQALSVINRYKGKEEDKNTFTVK